MESITLKWYRLERILKELCPTYTEIYITLTTHTFYGENEAGTISSVVFNAKDKVAEFLLNAYEVKSTEMVLKALAHEVVHVLRGSATHDNHFQNEWDDVYKHIVKEYNKP